MKVLNLYAGIGGNRKLWEDVEVTAVEINPEIAKVYQDYFPDDKIIIGDAHEYLLDHFKEFDFIWGSPPCPSHSRARFWASSGGGNSKPIYPDMKLYQEIILLDSYYKGKYCIENVVPFYSPLIPGKQIGRHIFWSNFPIGNFESKDADINRGTIKEWQYLHGFNLDDYVINQRKDQILRNCVHPETGLYILNCARNIITKQNEKQIGLFE